MTYTEILPGQLSSALKAHWQQTQNSHAQWDYPVLKNQDSHPALTPFPAIEPYDFGFLKVSQLHKIYYEQSGNPQGRPILFLHGGPGGGSKPSARQLYDPKKWRIIQFSQRGCGTSTPLAEIKENTTWDLVADMEQLREFLEIEKWIVTGGSWGSTLALAYACKHADRIESMVLRGVFLGRQSEFQWLYNGGAAEVFPDFYQNFLAPIAPEKREDMILAYDEKLNSKDENEAQKAALAWSQWEGSVYKLYHDTEALKHFSQPKVATAFARLATHYFKNNCFFDSDEYILKYCPGFSFQTIIVQGRYDIVCPPSTAFEVYQKLPKATLVMASDAGHSQSEIGITSALIEVYNSL